MHKIKTIKNSKGYTDCYIEIAVRNDFPGVRGNINSEFLDDLISVFERHCGVTVNTMPMSTRIGIYNISDENNNIINAENILKTIGKFIENQPQKIITKADIDYKISQDTAEKKENGQFFRDKRTIREQKMVDHAFMSLKAKGAAPWEYDQDYFMIRNLSRGFFKSNYENIQGVENLYEFSKKYTPK
jgi:hypothetical protein